MNVTKITILLFFLTLTNNLFSQEPQIVVTTGHSRLISRIAISPHGNFVASNSNTNIIKIWEINSGKEICSLNNKENIENNEERVQLIKFFEKGRRLVSSDENGKIKVWDIKSEKAIHTFYGGVGMPDLNLDISKNMLVFFDKNNSLCIADLDNLPVKTFPEIKVRIVQVNPANTNQVFIVDLENNFFLYDIEKKEKLMFFEKSERYVQMVSMSENGKNIAIVTGNSLKIWNMKSGKLIKQMDSLKIHSIDFNPKTNELAILKHNEAKHEAEILILNKNNFNEQRTISKGFIYSYFISISQNGEYIATNSMSMVEKSAYNSIDLMEWETGKKIKTLKGHASGILQIVASKNTSRIAALSNNLTLRIWNIAEQNIEKVFPFTRKIAINKDGNILALHTYSAKATNYTALVLWNLDSMKYITELPISEIITDLKICADNQHIIVSNLQGKISIWNIKNKTEVKTIQTTRFGNQVVDLSPDLRYVAASASGTGFITIYDLENDTNFELINSHQNLGASTINFSSDGKYIISGAYDTEVHIWETKNWTEVHDLYENTSSVSAVRFSYDNKIFASATEGSAVKQSDYGINVWKTETGEHICHLLGHTAGVKDVAFSGSNNLLYSGSTDGTIKIWDLDSCKEIASCIAIDYDDYIFTTPDFYYTGTRNALKGVGFKLNGTQLYPFEQFDLRLNRPDIIAERIKLASPELIEAFKKAYQKRLEKMGYEEDMFNNDFSLPELEIINKKEFDFKIEKNKIKLNIVAEDKKYELNRINIWINNIPIYGREGIDIASDSLQKIDKQIELKLTEGRNIIQVSVLNNKGVESLKETIEIITPTTEKKHDLYIITIGVSEYSDEKLNLKYAVKDAEEFGNLFKNESHIFDNVNVIPILDSNATSENIFATRSMLEKTKIDDMVIIFFAGHGIISEDFEYYFATTDVDVYNPADKGFSYEQLDELIDSIPARRKLIFVDACHSGEIDVDEYFNKYENIGENVFSRGIESRSSYNKIGLNNSFSLMKELFSDLRRGTGAVVIASSGGAEYSYESNKFQNGIFTHVLLNSIKSMESDTNKDGEISVVELRDYVIEEVSRLTKGKQNPTVRRENVQFNFKVW